MSDASRPDGGGSPVETQEYPITPAQAYRLICASLDLLATVSPSVHAKARQLLAAGNNPKKPLVGARELIELADALDGIAPGMAAYAIDYAETTRRAKRSQGEG
jgi:hypothetical protein